MREYRRAAHTVYALHYHFVFIPKYRKPVLRGDVGVELRDLIREICRSADIEILQGHIRPDHVHLLLSVPPHLAPSRVMQAIKGKIVAPSPPRSSKAAGGVLGSAPVGARLLRRDQRQCDRRDDCRVYSAARCRAPGRRPLSDHRVATPACAAMAALQSTLVETKPSPSGEGISRLLAPQRQG